MHAERVLPNSLYYTSKDILRPKRITFKSERIKLDPKSKELLTKYRKGLIWKK
jgi:hypothetical protein